eukprot:CAMPEP_0115163560 /NCGR_PEP_ID=MMETSP0227-20121206/72578_1 /TAXON_ID=89957 /ORGANISM="Polarella glacialis, Strain CCMP 1383" /LENGTH=148 /DNA_ID=CAMNT_0002575881 /DNA_START=92 /DNA_END=539 /DNA_ORIENTATION=-
MGQKCCVAEETETASSVTLLDVDDERRGGRVKKQKSAAEKGKSAVDALASAAQDTFEAILDKKDGKKLGIDVDHLSDKTGLLFAGSMEDWQGSGTSTTLSGKWNTDNPGREIHEGDVIREVNGETTPAAMLDRCKQDSKLVLRVKRKD